MKNSDEVEEQVDSETSDSDSDDEPKVFHEENLVIISSKEKISMNRWRIHLKKNWGRLMKENTRLLVLAGVHGKEDGALGENEVEGRDNFVKDSEGQVELLKREFTTVDWVTGQPILRNKSQVSH